MVLTACEAKQPEYRDRAVEVDIPIECVDAEMPECDFKKPTLTEVVVEMYKCTGLLKIELRKCIK